jgi:hypothetical protein
MDKSLDVPLIFVAEHCTTEVVVSFELEQDHVHPVLFAVTTEAVPILQRLVDVFVGALKSD